MTDDPQIEIAEQLHCAEQKLKTTIQMIESGQPCNQVLRQLHIIRIALRTAGAGVIERHAQSSQNIILNSTSAMERTVALHELESLYAIFVKQFNIKNEVNDE